MWLMEATITYLMALAHDRASKAISKQAKLGTKVVTLS